MAKQEQEKLREEWHVRSVNMAQEVTDYSKVEGMIADWWLEKIDLALANRNKEIVEKRDDIWSILCEMDTNIKSEKEYANEIINLITKDNE